MKTGRRKINQDFKGNVLQCIHFYEGLLNVIPKPREAKKYKFILKRLYNLNSNGVEDLIDVTGIMKKHKYKRSKMKDFLRTFDELSMSHDENYIPINKRVVSKAGKNVDNIFFTEFCIEKEKEFIKYLNANLKSEVVEQIENAIKKEKEKINNQFTVLDLDPWQAFEDQFWDPVNSDITNDIECQLLDPVNSDVSTNSENQLLDLVYSDISNNSENQLFDSFDPYIIEDLSFIMDLIH